MLFTVNFEGNQAGSSLDIGQIFSLNFRDGNNQVDVGVTIYGYKRKVYNEYLVLELPLEYEDGDTLVIAF